MGGPLAGIRVIELGQFAAGPVVGMLMADLGADVVKIEPPQGDPTRTRSLYDVRGESAYFLHFNRGKRSVVLDLKNREGLQALHDLIGRADVFVSNLRPGKLAALGLDWPALQALHPRLVACSVSGFGSVGPQRDRPSFDALPQAMGGLMSITGEPGGPPVLAGTPVGDLGAGMFAAMGVMAALVERVATGAGQHVDISMLDCMVWLVGYPAAYYLASGRVPGPLGSGHENAVPYGAYRTADGRYVFVAAHHAWEPLCRALERPDLPADERFRDRQARLLHRAALDEVLAGTFCRRTAREWLDVLADHDIPASPVNDLAAVMAEPQVVARSMRVEVPHPDRGTFSAVGNPIKLSAHQAVRFEAPPRLGADTAGVLRQVAGYSEERIRRLAELGVTGRSPAAAG